MDIGIFGVGSFGEKHIKVLQMISSFNIVGFFDPDTKRQKYIQDKYKLKAYPNPKNLITDVDAVDIASSTETHCEMIKMSMHHNKHIFVEKPICLTEIEIDKIMTHSKEYTSILQVGHIERYNPAITKEIMELQEIQSISCKRSGPLNNRNRNIPITLDLMIHDIDLIISIFKSNILQIKAIKKIENHSTQEKIEKILCEIKFQNGKTAYLDSERGTHNNRVMTIDCVNKKFIIDLLHRKQLLINKNTDQKIQKTTLFNNKNINPLKNEFLDFQKSIEKNKKPEISIEEGCKAVKVALEIEKIISK